jgi:AcrR family transcriptional regulator
MPSGTTPRSGRRGRAARNDRAILEAARAVFVADPSAPIAEVARRAGVGHSALYRRYPSKEALLRRLCREGLDRATAEVETALADRGDPWEAFAAFMRRTVDADTHSLTLRLAGTFAPTEDLYRDADRSRALTQQLLDRVREAGATRADLVVDDLSFLFEQLAAIQVGEEQRTRQLRHRYLALLLQGMRPAGPMLPGPAPRWDEIQRRWGERSPPDRTALT